MTRKDGTLTETESLVLRRTAEGMTNQEIGLELGITVATVKCHLNRIYKKTGTRNRVEATLWSLGRPASRREP
jgi:DNA-binding NarL/FixJ family response regulator